MQTCGMTWRAGRIRKELSHGAVHGQACHLNGWQERRPKCPDNQAVLQILTVTFPFFALVLCGYLAARKGMLPLQAIPGLNGFVLFFALPCLLYRFGASTPIAQLLDPAVALTYLFCALVMVAFVVAVTLHGRIGWNDAAFGALVGAFPNTGFMGVPLLVALLGPKAAGPAIVTILVDMVITTSLCIALSRLGEHTGENGSNGGVTAAQAAKNALKGVAANPMPWSILAGALVSALQLDLPQPVVATVGLLADSASPVALFTIGAVLARSHMLAQSGEAHHAVHWHEYVPVAAMKLFLHPLLVLLVGAAAMALGVPLDRFAFTVMVLLAALPSASNVSLLAERFGADNGRIARIILVSTAAAFFTFSGAVALMTGR
jgi:malonate transporter